MVAAYEKEEELGGYNPTGDKRVKYAEILTTWKTRADEMGRLGESKCMT